MINILQFRVPCPPKAPSCDCPCGFPSPPLPPMLPQFPSLLPPLPLFPQYPAYPSGAYATPDSNNLRQQVAENGLQQPFAHKTLSGISSQQRQSVSFLFLNSFYFAQRTGRVDISLINRC